MDSSVKVFKRKNPAKDVNPFAALSFTYMFPVFLRTFKKGLTEDDLFEPLPEHKSSILGEKLEKLWTQEIKTHKTAALHIALFKLFGFPFILCGILKLIEEMMFVVLMPFLVGKIVTYFEHEQTEISDNEALIYTGGLAIFLFFMSFASHPALMLVQHLSMKMRVATSSLIYRKSLKLSKHAMTKTSTGQAVNLLTNDVDKFDHGFVLAHYVWVGPLQLIVGSYLLYLQLGTSAFLGIGLILLFFPLQMWIGQRTSVLRFKTGARTDERVNLMSEIISGMQVIKMYCWEKPFSKIVDYTRRKEMKIIKQHAILIGIIYSFEMCITRSSIFLSLIAYVLLGNFVTAKTVFSVATIYTIIRPIITLFFSISISGIAEVSSSLTRINNFLSLEEINHEIGKEVNIIQNGKPNPEKPEMNGFISKCEKISLTLDNICASWSSESPENTLKDITMNVSANQLLAVIGPVGSGKSSLLNVILKEMPITQGSLEIKGKVSYSCQEPWLFTNTVRKNIIFNNDYNEERYREVVKVCALESDLALFSHGDKTLVGEKGNSLSGGQKARINLARAIYKEADIYLLDDPLSAVDANVGKHLFEKCIKEFLKGKICVLITHQLQYLKSADKIIILKNGAIQASGSYMELLVSGVDFAKLFEEFQSEEEEKTKDKVKRASIAEEEDEEEEDQVVEKEKACEGNIKARVYWKYLKSGGGTIMVVLLGLAFVVSQIVANANDYFITYWVDLEEDFAAKVKLNLTNETLDRNKIIYMYTGVSIGTVICALGHSMFFMLFFVIVSVNLHDSVFSKMILATMRFYNTNPSGRILNRFSKDMGIIDEYIPTIIFDVVEIGLMLIGVVALSSIVEPWLFPPTCVLMVLFYLLRRIYITTSRSVKRIEAIAKSPVCSHMSATMNGLSTIRAFSAGSELTNEFDRLQDYHSSAWYLFIASSRCFGLWLDVLCVIFIAATTFALVFFNKDIHGGDVGLIVTQYFTLLGTLQWGIRQWSELENQMTSVERVMEYTQLPTEPERPKTSLPISWPNKGKVEFRDVQLRYSPDDPYVLKSLSFVVNSNEKVGIVGRTGAGKSSTISALFQLYEIEGSVLIDGVDTTKIPLEDVRTKISIIPQEPVLFSGTMRKNLDPFEEYNDDVLWNALDEVKLKEVINNMPAGLNSSVAENGANFSIGQRQLVCLARALIRNNKILVLDEATANVDPHTDALIQKTIREKFAACTVFTIAHRLHTVMDSDRILVMDAGRVVEFDHPYILLKNESGILKNLVEDTGTSSCQHLLAIAKESYEKKK